MGPMASRKAGRQEGRQAGRQAGKNKKIWVCSKLDNLGFYFVCLSLQCYYRIICTCILVGFCQVKLILRCVSLLLSTTVSNDLYYIQIVRSFGPNVINLLAS